MQNSSQKHFAFGALVEASHRATGLSKERSLKKHSSLDIDHANLMRIFFKNFMFCPTKIAMASNTITHKVTRYQVKTVMVDNES